MEKKRADCFSAFFISIKIQKCTMDRTSLMTDRYNEVQGKENQ